MHSSATPPAASPDAPPVLAAEGLALTRGDRQLFAALDFALRPHEAVLVRGRNGAGKTSLLLLVAGILRPTAGRLTWSVGEEGDAGRQLHFIGYQGGLKPRLTVLENLVFWRRLLGGGGDAEAALAQVGLAGLESLPAGYLSAGQGRRLALARLLVAPRPVWLLDEPTAALDSTGTDLVGSLLAAHLEGGGVALVATHLDIRLAGQVQELRLGGVP